MGMKWSVAQATVIVAVGYLGILATPGIANADDPSPCSICVSECPWGETLMEMCMQSCDMDGTELVWCEYNGHCGLSGIYRYEIVCIDDPI